MPFDKFRPYTFSLVSVRNNAPDAPGVYGLSNAREWIFMGEADNIKAALLHHLRETHTALWGRQPTGFAFEVCAPHYRAGRKMQLIQEYQPFFTVARG